jgi:hypothetical protein
MAEPIARKTSVRKASDAFAQAQRRDQFVRDENAKARALSDAKTARLRALRLAKEAADREAEQKQSAAPSKPGSRLIPGKPPQTRT